MTVMELGNGGPNGAAGAAGAARCAGAAGVAAADPLAPVLTAQLEAALPAARREAVRTIAAALAPQDATEQLLAAQMALAHAAGMALFVEGERAGASARARDGALGLAARLIGLFTRQMTALDRHRAQRRQERAAEQRAAIEADFARCRALEGELRRGLALADEMDGRGFARDGAGPVVDGPVEDGAPGLAPERASRPAPPATVQPAEPGAPAPAPEPSVSRQVRRASERRARRAAGRKAAPGLAPAGP